MLSGAELITRALPDLSRVSERKETRGEGVAYVLFPSEHAVTLPEARARGLQTLLVPDGTWNQAKRMARRDPSCAGLVHVRLETTAKSDYLLRRNARPDGLCTFEAIAESMRELGDALTADAMLHAFARWVARAKLVRAGAHDSAAARALAGAG
jgi:DTW domain-containing protein YfiP